MSDIPTCWDVCEHCGEELHSQRHPNLKKRIFALCMHPSRQGQPVFEFDAICELVKRPPVVAPLKPASRGWADY